MGWAGARIFARCSWPGRGLWPELWEFVSDESRYAFGIRYGRFQASAETGQATAARTCTCA